MIVIPDAEKRTIVSSFLGTKHRNVTARRTDGQNRCGYYSGPHCEQCGPLQKVCDCWCCRCMQAVRTSRDNDVTTTGRQVGGGRGSVWRQDLCRLRPVWRHVGVQTGRLGDARCCQDGRSTAAQWPCLLQWITPALCSWSVALCVACVDRQLPSEEVDSQPTCSRRFQPAVVVRQVTPGNVLPSAICNIVDLSAVVSREIEDWTLSEIVYD